MARLSSIRGIPSDYLGSTGDPEQDRADHECYISAVEELIRLGVQDERACEIAWAEGDFIPRCQAILDNPAAFVS